MFLTPDEIADLSGYKPQSVAHQCRWLDRHGFPFELSATGRPKVLRSYVERRMGLATQAKKSQCEPDFSKWEDR